MSVTDDALKNASERRLESLDLEDLDRSISLLLSHYEEVTANARSMGYLRFLLRHYAKDPHPWRACYRDNLKRFGDKTAALCGVLKDTIRQDVHWRGRHGLDHGAPGVAIAEADAPAAPSFGGHHRLAEESLGPMPEEVALVLEDIASQCDVFRVLIGLDEPPRPSASFLALAEVS